MTNPNLKIPLALLKKYKLSTLAILIYGELNGLYSKYHKCEITDKQLTQRLNRSNTRVQYGLNELKKNNLIFSKQKPNYRGRSIQVPQINDKKCILVPVSIIRNKDLSQNALLVYGSLYSRFQKQIKINRDKRIDDDILIKIKNCKDKVEFLNLIGYLPYAVQRKLYFYLYE